MHYLSDPTILMSRSALTALGSLCGTILGRNLTELPSSIKIHNYQFLEEPEDWIAAQEKNAPTAKPKFLNLTEKQNQQLKLF